MINPEHESRMRGAATIGVANSIRAARRRKSMTVAALAATVGVDKGFISRIERGQKLPSIGTLLKIAAALDMQVGQLVGEATPDDAITVIRKGSSLELMGSGATSQSQQILFGSSSGRRFNVFLLSPGIEKKIRATEHPGEEFLYVLEGSIEITFTDRVLELEAGDGIVFDGHLRHLVRRLGTAPSRALIVVSQDFHDPPEP